MKNYFVSWEMEVVATTPEEAAQEALDSVMHSSRVFYVYEIIQGVKVPVKTVDLAYPDELHELPPERQ